MSTLAQSLTALLAIFTFAACGGGGPGEGDDSPDGGFTDPDDDASNGDCEPDIVPAPAGLACAAATRTCMDACAEDDTCFENCLTADPDPENCGTCLEEGYIACVNEAGCQAEWDTLICCFDGCADPESEACETECTPQGNVYDTCIEAYDEGCFEMTNTACFKAS